MGRIFQFDLKFPGKITVLLAFSFFAAGCHTGNEPIPVPKATVKKETASRVSGSPLRNTAKAKTKTSVKTDTESEQNRPVSFLHYKSINHDAAAQRDPFALPAELQEPQNLFKYNRKEAGSTGPFTNSDLTNHAATKRNNQQTMQEVAQKIAAAHTAVPMYSPEPCIAGIFDNGREKFALVRWQKVQGVFRCGESLGNGFYVKEITAGSVLLCPEQKRDGTDTIKLTLE